MIRDTSATDRSIARKARPRRVAAAAAVAALALPLTWYTVEALQRFASAPLSVSAASLRFAPVERGDLLRDVTVQGRIVAAVRPTMFAPAAGRARLHVEAGDPVQAGDLLIEIESPELASSLEQERATLDSLTIAVERARIEAEAQELELAKAADQARVNLTAAEREYDRAAHSRRLQIVSDFDYRKAADDLERARIELGHAEADTELGRKRLGFEVASLEFELARQRSLVADLQRQVSDLTLRSPAAGIVGDLQIEQGAAVARHQALLTVVDLTALQVELLVPESYADELAPGMAAQVNLGSKPAPATVVAISPEVRDGQVAVHARFDAAVPSSVRQNQRLSVRVLLDHRIDVVKVQRGGFMESGGGRIAYVHEGDLLVRRSVHLVPGSLREVQVLEGLEPGEQIVIDHLDRFDGAERVLLTR